MKAIWGICIGAAVVLAGFLAWTYTVEPEAYDDVAALFFFMDLALAGFIAVTALPRVASPAPLADAMAQWRAWRRRMPARLIWTTGVMAAAGVVLTLGFLGLTRPVSKVDGTYRLSTGKYTYATISREEYVEGRSNGLRLFGGAGVVLLSLASFAFTVPLAQDSSIPPDAGTSRTTGRP